MPARVVVYTLNYCPYCYRVKELLKKRGIAFEEVDLTDNDSLREKIAKKSGQETAPQVFVNDKAIGGYAEVRRLDEQGLLGKLICGE